MNAGSAFGWIAGPLAGGLIYDRWGYSAALTVSILIAVITLLVALWGIPDSPSSPRSAAGEHGPRPSLRASLPASLSSFWTLLSIFFAVLFAWAFIEPRFMFYAYNDLGWSSSMLGLVMSTYGVAMMFGEVAFGQLSDRGGRRPGILLGLGLFSAQFLGLALFRNHLLIVAAFVIAGLGNALYDPALSAAILDISPAEHHSRILGIKGMAGSTGSILGPALVALLNASVEARGIFLMATGIVLLALVSGLALPWRNARAQVVPARSD